MVKCPHCGSTAQVKSNGNPIISKRGFLAENFSCGCGCNWEINYDRNKKGYWQVSHIETMMKETINKPKGHIHCPCNGTDCIYWRNGLCVIYSEEENWTDPYEACVDFSLFWEADDDYIDYD